MPGYHGRISGANRMDVCCQFILQHIGFGKGQLLEIGSRHQAVALTIIATKEDNFPIGKIHRYICIFLEKSYFSLVFG